jgi:MFS family permease
VGAAAASAGLIVALPYLMVNRVFMGLGEACFFVGAATMVTDLAPVSRRGEAVSYFSVALWGGLSLGPVAGETILDRTHFDRVWYLAGALAIAAALVATTTKETRGSEPAPRGPLIHRAAIRPGILLAAGLVGITGFSIFLPLYAPDAGVHDVGIFFLIYGLVVLSVRVFGARLPDTLGPLRAGTIATGSAALGLAVTAAWQSGVGLALGTVLVAIGSSFLYPALLLLALDGIPESERGSVVGSFSAFFDLSSGLSGVVLGGIAALSSYQGAYIAAALIGLGALVLLRTGFGRPAAGASAAAEHDSGIDEVFPVPGIEPAPPR